MTWTIKLKRGTATEWTSGNPTLENGEPGYETDTGKIKYGDGSTAWTSLAYFTVSGAGGGGSYTDTSVDTHLNQSSATTGQVLSWDGSDYSWVAQSGGGGAAGVNSIIAGTGISVDQSTGNVTITNTGGGSGGSSSVRTSTTATITSIAPASSSNQHFVDLPKTYVLLGVETSHPSWTTFYTSIASRTADTARSMTSDPNPNSGVIAEIIHQSSGASGLISFTPAVLGFIEDEASEGQSGVPIKVHNLGATTATMTITAHYLELEA